MLIWVSKYDHKGIDFIIDTELFIMSATWHNIFLICIFVLFKKKHNKIHLFEKLLEDFTT